MTSIKSRKLTAGVYWVEIKPANVKMLCASPADTIKFLIREKFVGDSSPQSSEITPNVILLSDKRIQNECASNLLEFPVLHMLFIQGTLVPGHVNYGKRPILTGRKKLLDSQLKYLYVGNYGITNQKELEKLSPNKKFAADLIDFKRRLANGAFKRYTSLLDIKPNDGKQKKELINGVCIRRKAENNFEITYKKDSLTVDLNLKKNETYGMTVQLPKVTLPKGQFTVTNTGMGDGWDPYRTCFSSLVRFKSRNYLIDVGPNMRAITKSMGLVPEKIDGIFQTHIHDDHFGGYELFWHCKKRISVYSVPPVIRSMQKKLMYMFGTDIREVKRKFNFVEMEYDKWFGLEEMEIIPFNSLHPVETAIFAFRNNDGQPGKMYAHYGDLASFESLKKIFKDDADPSKKEFYMKYLKTRYLMRADIKKIDAGGGLIHGMAEDFADDKTEIKLLGHNARNLNEKELRIGISEPYGYTHILIK